MERRDRINLPPLFKNLNFVPSVCDDGTGNRRNSVFTWYTVGQEGTDTYLASRDGELVYQLKTELLGRGEMVTSVTLNHCYCGFESYLLSQRINVHPSSNGRTSDFESENLGSNPRG